MYNWYGPNNAFLNESTHNYFNVSPLGHMINIDGGGFHSRDELFSHMRYVRSNFLTHPNYERWRDKYIVTLFAKSGNDPNGSAHWSRRTPIASSPTTRRAGEPASTSGSTLTSKEGSTGSAAPSAIGATGSSFPPSFPASTTTTGKGKASGAPWNQPASGRQDWGQPADL